MTLARRSFVLGGLAAACAPAPRYPATGEPRFAAAARKTVAIPLPAEGFDPTEVGVPWALLTRQGVTVVFASPVGRIASADPRMLTGEGLGRYADQLRADLHGRAAHHAMRQSPDFRNPRPYSALRAEDFDALILPGGHAPGMKVYLESPFLRAFVGEFFATGRPVGAICHGVVLAARSRAPGEARSVLHGKKTTALPRRMEKLAWTLTRSRLGDYYRTYPTYVQDEGTAVLREPSDFVIGPRGIKRDAPHNLRPGFVVVDGRYVSARWPGDAHRFALAMLEQIVAA
jgi:putative intracellular protease/amidase